MAMVIQSKLPSTLKLLQESLFLLTNNWRPLLPILLLHLLFSSLTSLSNYLSLSPILADVAASFASLSALDTRSPNFSLFISSVRKDLREIALIEALFLALAFTFSSLITIAAVHLISMACSEKPLNPQELPSLIKKTWRGPLLTQLCATVLHFSGGFFILLLVSAVMFISIGSAGLTTAGVLLSITGFLSYLFLALICSLSTVVSVVEEGCYGLAAIERSLELTNGRKKMGVLAMLALTATCGFIFLVYSFLMIHSPGVVLVRAVIGFANLAVFVVVNAYALSVITVFYYECRSHEGGLLAIEKGLAYSGLSTVAEV